MAASSSYGRRRRSRGALALAAGCLAVAPALSEARSTQQLTMAGEAGTPPGVSYAGIPVLSLEYRADPPLRMPTAVAVAPDGTVYVADGVHDRILVFAADGAPAGEIREVGGEKLLRPISIKVDDAGRLWIADTGSARVLVRGVAGNLEHTVIAEKGAAAQTPDITDLAISPDGRRAWLVDNDNHRLIRWESETGTLTFLGQRGESAGQFQYPFMLALGHRGELFVTDVLNARVQVLTDLGEPAATLGTYGVDVGQLYRPKGVACDAEGNVWVADSTLGVVQVFTPTGRLIDVLRDEQGELLRFQSPGGITFDRDGNLYVAELTADRVRKVRIAKTPQPPTERGPAALGREFGTQPGAAVPRQAAAEEKHSRSCTICHIQWLPGLSDAAGDGRTPRGTALMRMLSESPEDPIVSRSETCLSCHDGSVVDSRRRVWQEHGHRTGIQPPDSMSVPPSLPLVNERIACRTCHSAHAGGTSPSDLSGAVFLRVPNTASELCVSCHADKAGGAALGTHPTGSLPWAVPPALREAGARAGSAGQLTCQVCHTPHGSAHERLLVLGTGSNELCLTCHAQMQPELFRDDPVPGHPLGAPATPAQAAAAEQLGTTLSPDGRLLCLSCHKLHHAKGNRFLLADELADSQLCIHCHADQRDLLGTAHDLRRRFADEPNQLGMTAGAAGPCSSCHLVHHHARAPEVSPVAADAGQCLTCHQDGRCGQSRSLGPITHPAVKCSVCHDPHQSKTGSFLRQPAAELCNECHDHGEEIGGAHAFEGRPDLVNPRGQSAADTGSCLICHSMHHAVAKPLWGAAPVAPKTDREQCTVCHQAGGVAEAAAVKPLNHPLACTTCHNPHADSSSNPALLVVDPPAQNLCVRCHDENLALVDGPHDFKGNPAAWPAASTDTGDRCLACHRLHSEKPDALFRNGLGATSGPDAACLACHSKSAWDAQGNLAALHPRRGDLLDAAGELPLVPAAGGEGEQIGCRTCHNPHAGKGPPAHLVRAEEDEPGAALCLQCHEGKERIERTGHSAASLRRNGLEADACQPCHNVHGDPAAVARPLLWAPQLEPQARLPGEQRCRGCHHENGPARPPAIFTHPDVLMRNTSSVDAPGYLPLFNEHGEVDPHGRISCPTCHLPHGRPPGDERGLPPAAKVQFPQLQSAMRLDLRPFLPPNLCNTCHGLDALRRFLYFHEPARRQGPLSGKPATLPEHYSPATLPQRSPVRSLSW